MRPQDKLRHRGTSGNYCSSLQPLCFLCRASLTPALPVSHFIATKFIPFKTKISWWIWPINVEFIDRPEVVEETFQKWEKWDLLAVNGMDVLLSRRYRSKHGNVHACLTKLSKTSFFCHSSFWKHRHSLNHCRWLLWANSLNKCHIFMQSSITRVNVLLN